jgi:transposase
MQIARRLGMKKAIVALARLLAVILHRIWVNGTAFRWSRDQATAAVRVRRGRPCGDESSVKS